MGGDSLEKLALAVMEAEKLRDKLSASWKPLDTSSKSGGLRAREVNNITLSPRPRA
jgi:hypothetical protein